MCLCSRKDFCQLTLVISSFRRVLLQLDSNNLQRFVSRNLFVTASHSRTVFTPTARKYNCSILFHCLTSRPICSVSPRKLSRGIMESPALVCVFVCLFVTTITK